MALATQAEVYDIENRGTGKANDSEPPHKFAAVPSVCVQVSVAEESSSRTKARGSSVPIPMELPYSSAILSKATNVRSVNCSLNAIDALLF